MSQLSSPADNHSGAAWALFRWRITRRGVIQRSGLLVGGGLVLLVYAIVALFVLPPAALWSPDEGAKLLQVQNLRWHDGQLSYAIRYTGQAIDPTLEFAQADSFGLLRIREGQLYFQRLPLFPLMTLPFFAAFGMAGLYMLPALAGAACGVLAVQLLQHQ